MSKQKLAEMVMKKIQQKKLQEQRNRPHREVLQLLVKFQVEDYDQLTKQIQQLTRQIQVEQKILDKLKQCNQEFQNTGKKDYPRIIIKPDFIATEHVKPQIKQYYRKTSNTFLRQDLLRKRQYDSDVKLFEQIKAMYSSLKQKQDVISKQQQIKHKITNQKRVRNLKQDLRLRAIREQQELIKKTIQEEKFKYKDLLAQYDLKKTNLNKRQDWANQLIPLIENQKRIIEETYNPITYRDYLKKIFNIRTKNQSISLNLIQINKKVEQSKNKNDKKTQFLEKNDNLFKQGKCFDSPSKKKRFSVGSMEKQDKIKSRSSSLLFNLKKSIFYKSTDSPLKLQNADQNTLKNKSFSTSLGKTASSMKDLLKDSISSRRSLSFSTELKKAKNSYIASRMFA